MSRTSSSFWPSLSSPSRRAAAWILALSLAVSVSPAIPPAFAATDWSQLGSDITGTTAGDRAGATVAISGDGRTIAVGSATTPAGAGAGSVSVYRFSDGAWNQLGSTLLEDETFGTALALNNDGTILAVGEPDANYVAVYRYAADWTLAAGDQLSAPAGFSEFGYAVSLTGDGSRVIIGAPGTGTDKGAIQVLENSGMGWAEAFKLEESTTGRYGSSVAIADNGLRMVVGKPGGTIASCSGTGSVSIINDLGGSQNIISISGEDTADCWGHSVAISSDGNVLAAGAPLNDDGGTDAGQVRVWGYDSSSWTQLGGDFDGSVAGAKLGSAVALDSAGSILAAGSSGEDSVAVYSFNTGEATWSAIGSPISGADSSTLGRSVSIDSAGTRVIVGAPEDDSAGVTNAGLARVFTSQSPSSTSSAPSDQPGIFLSVSARPGSNGNHIRVHYGGYRARLGSTYTLEVQSGSKGRLGLAEGTVSRRWFDATTTISALPAGTHLIVFAAYSPDGTLLRLGNRVVVEGDGTVVSVTAEKDQPYVF